MISIWISFISSPLGKHISSVLASFPRFMCANPVFISLKKIRTTGRVWPVLLQSVLWISSRDSWRAGILVFPSLLDYTATLLSGVCKAGGTFSFRILEGIHCLPGRFLSWFSPILLPAPLQSIPSPAFHVIPNNVSHIFWHSIKFHWSYYPGVWYHIVCFARDSLRYR